MSLILDALNKADRERQNTATPPGINTVQDTQAFQAGRPWWHYTVMVLFILLLLGLAFWLYRVYTPSTPGPTITHQPEAVEAPKKSTRIPGLPKPVLVKKESEAPAAIQPKKIEKPAQQPAINTLYAQKESEETSKPLAPANEQKVAAQIDTTAPVQAPPKKPTLLSDYPQIGSVGQLPWTILNALPSLNYSGHQYAGERGRSYITINEQRKAEGQNLRENVRIDHILKDGVILSYQNHQFKLKALSSWVNI